MSHLTAIYEFQEAWDGYVVCTDSYGLLLVLLHSLTSFWFNGGEGRGEGSGVVVSDCLLDVVVVRMTVRNMSLLTASISLLSYEMLTLLP